MEEARRFLRYVIPGLVFIIEIMATLPLMDFNSFKQLLTQINDVGAVLALLAGWGTSFQMPITGFTGLGPFNNVLPSTMKRSSNPWVIKLRLEIPQENCSPHLNWANAKVG